jgi:hypothetical protein
VDACQRWPLAAHGIRNAKTDAHSWVDCFARIIPSSLGLGASLRQAFIHVIPLAFLRMPSGSKSPTRGARFETLAAIVLAILAIGSFAIQALTLEKGTSPRETVLFNTLQFLLTLGFGWFSTRALSRAEFERSLKQFAIGAYRRISDIETMIERLQQRVRQAHGDPEADTVTDLHVVSAVLDDTVLVVRSSTADWADVIGEEILALEQIAKLRREKTELQAESGAVQHDLSASENVTAIDEEIQELVKRLPLNLRVVSSRSEDDDTEKRHRVEWMRWRHQEENGLRLRIVAGGIYRCDGDLSSLTPTTALFAMLDGATGGVPIEDTSGRRFGSALNNSPLDYAEFRELLVTTFGITRLPVQFLKNVGDNGEGTAWYEVKVTADPLPEDDRPHAGLVRRRRHKPSASSK